MTASDHSDHSDHSEHRTESEPVLNDIWSHDPDDLASVDPDCSPTKVCRNARDFTFDGIADVVGDATGSAETGSPNLATSWRTLLEREGKLVDGGSPVRDLMFGSSND